MKISHQITTTATVKYRNGVRVEIPAETVAVDLDIDQFEIARLLGNKAWKNKSKKAVEIGGYITATVRKAVSA